MDDFTIEPQDISAVEALLQGDVEATRSRKPPKESMTMAEYLALSKNDPSQSVNAHAKMYQMIREAGYEEITHESDPRRARLLGVKPDGVLRVPKFWSGFFGVERALVQLDQYFYAAAGLGEESRQVCFLLGPPSSGKSTAVERLRVGLERYGFWAIEGCPQQEDPVNATPRHLRPTLAEQFGIFIHPKADLCPLCRYRLREEFGSDYTRFTVVWRQYSQRNRCGIGVVSEVDPINFDIGLLVGHEDISMIDRYARGHPLTLTLDGAFNIGNRGMIEFVEMYKNPPESHRPIITVTQENYVAGPKLQGQIFCDAAVLAHSNEGEWVAFSGDKKNEAILDRMRRIRMPYNLRLAEEVEIYKGSFLGRSREFRHVHIDPYALEQVAMFAILTRLRPSTKCSDLLTKLKLYDGETVMEKGEIKQIKISELEDEAGPQEGMVGVSYRDMVKSVIDGSIASNRAEWQKDEELKGRGYLNVLWVREALLHFIATSEIPEDGDWPKPSKRRWREFVKDILHKEWMKKLDEDISKANIHAFEEQAQSLFENLLDQMIAYHLRRQGRKYVDRLTKEELEPDRKWIGQIVSPIVTESGVDAFVSETAVAILDLERSSGGATVSWRDYDPMREVIEAHLKGEIRDTVRVVVKEGIRGDLEQRKRYDIMVEQMRARGYANLGIAMYLQYARNHLYRD